MSSYVNDYCNTVQTYYRDLKKCNPISRDEEKDLMKRAKKNDIEARNKIFTSNLKFVFDVARKYRGCGVALPDLISEGNMGLMKAIDKFDEDRDIKFISYAVWWIKQSIIDFIKKTQNKNKIEVDNNELNESKYDSCSDSEYDDDIICIEQSDDDFDSVEEENSNMEMLSDAMSVLDERELSIIKAYFGIGQKKEMNLDEIGNSLNISSERVRQIKKNAIRKMRNEIMSSDNF